MENPEHTQENDGDIFVGAESHRQRRNLAEGQEEFLKWALTLQRTTLLGIHVHVIPTGADVCCHPE